MASRQVAWLSGQVGALSLGTAFAFSSVAGDFIRFCSFGDSVFSLRPLGPFPHPITTPCFWGALAFLGALIWALAQLRWKSPRQQQWLVWFLLGGSAFAWSNVALQFYQFYTAAPGQQVSCSGVPIDNPFATACFIGATLFLVSLLCAWRAERALRR